MTLNAEEVKQMRKLLFCHICEATGLGGRFGEDYQEV